MKIIWGIHHNPPIWTLGAFGTAIGVLFVAVSLFQGVLIRGVHCTEESVVDNVHV